MKALRALALPLFAAAVAALAGCSSLELGSDYDPATDFTRFKTFDFKEGSKPRNPVARRSVEYAIQTALEGRGMKAVDGKADLDVFVHFVLDARIQWDTYGYGTYGWYGWGWGGAAVTTGRVIPTGTVLIDLVDPARKVPVWRGIVKDDISTSLEPEEREKKAIGIARQLFENFPPQKKKG
jgi:hypothetical protein